MGKIGGKLKISKNHRYLVKEDGSPFFWLADTAWELFHRLDRNDGEIYLKNRAQMEFTVIQAALLAESEDFRTGNAYGRLPFHRNEQGEKLIPDVGDGYSYWEHVDYLVFQAKREGLYMALLPTWGDKINQMGGIGPEIFEPGNAYEYGEWLGEHFRNTDNVLWILGGDRPLVTRKHFEILNAIAEGIRQGDRGGHLMSFHPYGGYSSSYQLRNEPWMDFHMIQSGHGASIISNYRNIQQDYEREEKPVLDAEPCYEDHPIGFQPENGYFDASNVRRAAYWSVFSGACGHSYGHHCIWSMNQTPGDYFLMSWRKALDRPGAKQMRYLKRLVESKDYQQCLPAPELIEKNYGGANYISALKGTDFAWLYIPCGLPVRVKTEYWGKGRGKAFWFSPRTGKRRNAGSFWAGTAETFYPPTSGRGEDWVLELHLERKEEVDELESV